MREKHLPLFLVALALIALMTVPAFADPVAATSPSIGDRYAITPISGEARAWVAGSWVVSSANLQLVVQVTNVGPNNIIFRTLSGTIRFDDKVYNIVADGWRGDYNRVSKTCVYQGPAVAPNGARAFFIIYGHDTSDTQQGTYMRMWSAFRDENAVLWRIDLQTYRFKLN
jgi:hypothetical protein